ncbi:MAG: bis-aminopropyl spermidine synthase family protein [Myxococcales bacterium]|nr:bis-aminopropyl spermidine synthase family protein [Myxococcales bacterium]
MDTPAHVSAPARAERQILFALAHRGELGWGALLDAQDASIPEFVAALQALRGRGAVVVTRGRARLAAAAAAPTALPCVCSACDGRGYAAPPGLPALAELRAALADRPAPNFAFDQGAIPSEESLLRAASMQDRGDLWGQEVLFVGDFDLTSVALALTRQPARVVVLDIDPRVVEFVDAAGARLGLPLSGRRFDVRDPLPDDLRRRFDVFVCDPVETLPGIRLYLARGAAALRGEGSAAWLGLTTIEASRRKWFAIQQILAQSGLVVTDIRRRFSGYPDHDEALALPGLEWPILQELGPEGGQHRWYTSAWLRAEAVRVPEPAVDGRVDLGDELYVDDEAWATPRQQETAR